MHRCASSRLAGAAARRAFTWLAAAAAAGRGRSSSSSSSSSLLSASITTTDESRAAHVGGRCFSSSSSGGGGGTNVFGQPLEVDPFPHDSVLLDTDHMRVTDTSDFSTRLLVTIQKLRQEGKSAIWVKVHALNGHLLGVLGTFGFRMHHCEGDGHVMLNLWLRKGENKIPPFATHLVGVAGLVLNAKKEVLLVKEQSKRVSGWKLPGGFVELGEEFGDAACREVEEETGVQCTFKSVLALRHQHNVAFGRSDIYVVTRLQAQTEEIKICPSEIEDARWVPFSQFSQEASHPILKTVARLTAGLDLSKEDGEMAAGDIVETEHPSILLNRPNYKLYHPPLGRE